MSSLHGPLEALLTPDDGPIGTLQGAAPLPHVNPVVWISFSGGPNESVTSFIQSVQRAAFQHNRIKDDEWIAELASTCFTDTALLWYLGLENKTQSSWAKLRIALVERYTAQGGSQALQQGRPGVPVLSQPTLSPTATNNAALNLTDTSIVEVLLPFYGDVLGYLSQDSTGNFVVDPDAEKALKLQKVLHTDSDKQDQKIYSLKILDAPDPRFPFLGLKLVKFPGENPNAVPQHYSAHDGRWNPARDVPSCCNIPKSDPDQLSQNFGLPKSEQKTTPWATWDFVQATESGSGRYYIRKAEGPDPKTRVVSAVWTVLNPMNNVAGLGLTWPAGDGRNALGTEIPLDPVLHGDGITGLHVHSSAFARRWGVSRSQSLENYVVFVFKQVSSS